MFFKVSYIYILYVKIYWIYILVDVCIYEKVSSEKNSKKGALCFKQELHIEIFRKPHFYKKVTNLKISIYEFLYRVLLLSNISLDWTPFRFISIPAEMIYIMHRKVTRNYDRDIQHTYKKGRKKEIKKQHTSRQKEQRYNERSNETTGLARRGRKNKMCCSRKHTEKDTLTVR